MSWHDPEREDTTVYKVVVNHEEQYSIWPEYKENPFGWKEVGKVGQKTECLAYIKEVWTDMRPLSLRKKMEEMAKNPGSLNPTPDLNQCREKSLVDRLCEGDHAVEASMRPARTAQSFKEAIDRDYIHVKFTDTKGGTELGVRIDRDASDFSKADFEVSTGTVHVEGLLTLDHERVRCIADIDVASLVGKGNLIRVEAQSAER